ncbi:hypothetical protein [Actinomadura macrotermitis]|uniref:Uncharacterized protein n=1 Tax=Actinomadura macrotermitis TaxID=2585200 RepID=A0A7K0BXM6_9ACTN|nr:hypothetical protein [Actinomadura macrotermitis]MQY05836.1 hypothetical protein [Actinomadura macrotermitis]
MRSFSARLAATAVAFVALAPVSAAHAEPTPATLNDVPLPFLWPSAGVYSVAAVSDTEAWVAGVQGNVGANGGNGGNPVVRRRVGSQWKEYPLNGWTGNGRISQVVAYNGEVWVQGVQGVKSTSGERLYLARFDGTAFQPVAPPEGVADGWASDTRLWMGPAGVWIQVSEKVGDDGIGPKLYRRVGTSWQADALAGQLTNGLPDLQALSATAAWTGGCRFNPGTGRNESAVLRWNGSAWTAMPALPVADCVVSVAPAAGGVVWALTPFDLFKWDGTAWTKAPEGPDGPYKNGYGEKVRLDKDGNPVVIASDLYRSATKPPIRLVGGAWQKFTTPTATWAIDLSVAPGGRIWVTGSSVVYSPMLLATP